MRLSLINRIRIYVFETISHVVIITDLLIDRHYFIFVQIKKNIIYL